MKDDHEYGQKLTWDQAKPIALKVRNKLPEEQIADLYTKLSQDEGVAEYYKSPGIFNSAVTDVLVGMVMEDPSIGNVKPKLWSTAFENNLQRYAVDEAYRTQNAGMARS